MIRLFLFLLLVVALPAAASAQEVLQGTTRSRVTDVIDGDSIRVRARVWLGQDVSASVRLVGIDYLSIEKFKSETFETHLALLSKGVVIVEGLDLRAVPAGVYELICLPLKIAAGSGDGAPARAVLRTLD